MDNIFLENWESIVRTSVLTVLGYLAMVILLRVSGKRTLSKMNGFDFVITIALGSCLASVSLNKDITLSDGILAFSLFIFMQYIFTFLSVRWKKFRALITNTPVIVFYEGRFLSDEMKVQRLSQEDVLSECRLKGYSNMDNVHVVILESTGEISIVENNQGGEINTHEKYEQNNKVDVIHK